MKFIKEYSGLVALVIIAIMQFAPAVIPFGASGTRFPNGISADTTSPVAGEVRGDDLTLDDDAVIADQLTVNDSAFCINVYATSTATRGNFTASTTATVEGSDGLLVFGYGACQ